MTTYFFASPVDVDVRLEDEDARKKVDIKGEKERIISCPVYYDGESVAGQVRSSQTAGFRLLFISISRIRPNTAF